MTTLLYNCYTFSLILRPPLFLFFGCISFPCIILNTNQRTKADEAWEQSYSTFSCSIVCPYCKQSRCAKCTGTINTCVPTIVQIEVIKTHYTNSKKGGHCTVHVCVTYCSPNRCSSNVQASNLTKFSSTTWN